METRYSFGWVDPRSTLELYGYYEYPKPKWYERIDWDNVVAALWFAFWFTLAVTPAIIESI